MSDQLKFNEDPECIAYQFINDMERKDGSKVTNKNGNTIQTVSFLMLGKGGEDAGMTAGDINAAIAERKVTGFVNGSVIVYKARVGGGSTNKPA